MFSRVAQGEDYTWSQWPGKGLTLPHLPPWKSHMQVIPFPCPENWLDSHHPKLQLMEKQIVDEGIDKVSCNSSYNLGQYNSLKQGETTPCWRSMERDCHFLPKHTLGSKWLTWQAVTGKPEVLTVDALSLLLLPVHPPILSSASFSLRHKEHSAGHRETWAGDEKAAERKKKRLVYKSAKTSKD